jgi:RNA polymerase-binding transcription factor DksA
MPNTETPEGHITRDAAGLLRSLLLCQLAEHIDQAHRALRTVDELTGQTDSDSVLERELAEGSAAHFTRAMAQARDALRRLDDGTYGICEACGGPIAYERLEAIPHTLRCVACSAGPAGR